MLAASTAASALEPGVTQTLTDKFYWRAVEDSLFVVELCRYSFTILNGTAALIWLSLLDQKRSRESVVEILEDAFGVSPSVLRADVEDILSQWEKLGWIETYAAGRISIPAATGEARPPPYRTIARHAFDAAVANALASWTINLDLAGQAVTIRLFGDPGMDDSDISIRASSFLKGIPTAPIASS